MFKLSPRKTSEQLFVNVYDCFGNEKNKLKAKVMIERLMIMILFCAHTFTNIVSFHFIFFWCMCVCS